MVMGKIYKYEKKTRGRPRKKAPLALVPYKKTDTEATKNTRRIVRRAIATQHKGEKRFTIGYSYVITNPITKGNNFQLREFTDIDKGDLFYERAGNQVKIHGINMCFTVSNPSTLESKGFRIIVLKERNYGALDMTGARDGWLANLFTGIDFQDRAQDGLSGDYNHSLNRRLFDVVYDKRTYIPTELEGRGMFSFNKTLKINKTLHYKIAQVNGIPTNGRMFLITMVTEIDNTPPSSLTLIQDGVLRVFYSSTSSNTKYAH